VRPAAEADPGTAGAWIGSAAERRLAAMNKARITHTSMPAAAALLLTVASLGQ
jgi:hypothetical protein